MIKQFNIQLFVLKLFIFCCVVFLLQCAPPSKEQINPNEKQKNVGINKEKLNKIKSSKTKAAYLSFDIGEVDFGSIVLIDLVSGNQVKILDNQFYITSPIFFGNTNVLFASAREGSPEGLKISKYHAWRQLYYFDLEKVRLKNYYSKRANPTSEEISHFESLNWDSTRNQIFVLESSKKVYKISNETREPLLIFQPIEETYIGEISLSPNDGYLAIECFHPKIGASIKIYSLFSDSVITELKDTPESKAYLLLGWSSNNNVYCKLDSVKEYDFKLNSVTNININLERDQYSIKQIFPESEETIILLVDILEKNLASRFPNTVSTEIARYNFETNGIEWITKDGTIKHDLNVLVRH